MKVYAMINKKCSLFHALMFLALTMDHAYASLFNLIEIDKFHGNSNEQQKETDNVKFSEIIGIDTVLTDIKEIVDYVKNHQKYKNFKTKIYRNILPECHYYSDETIITEAPEIKDDCHTETVLSFNVVYRRRRKMRLKIIR